MIDLKLTYEQASALHYALILHTREDSYEFPGARVVLLRQVIDTLDDLIEKDT